MPKIKNWSRVPSEENHVQKYVWEHDPSGSKAMIQGLVEDRHPVSGREVIHANQRGQRPDFYRFWSATRKDPIYEHEDLETVRDFAVRWMRKHPRG